MGYFDGLPKIQLLCGKYPVAAVGQTIIGRQFVHTHIADFSRKANPDVQPEMLFQMLRDYMASLQPHFSNAFFGAAYHDHSPYLFGFTSSAFYSFSSGVTGNRPDLLPYVDKYNKNLFTCKECQTDFERIIYRFAEDKHRKYEIGGPVSVIRLDKDNRATWLQNEFSKKHFGDKAGFLEAVQQKAIRIVPVNGYSVQEVIQALQHKWG